MIVTLYTQGIKTLEEIRNFVSGASAVTFQPMSREAACLWMEETLRRFHYRSASRGDKGLLRQYLGKVSGLSRAQVTRRITQFLADGGTQDRRGPPAAPFRRRYTDADIRLLAEMDALHGNLSGSTTRKLCERAYHVHGDARFERLATISNGHLYNLRRCRTYQQVRGSHDQTRPVRINIGEIKAIGMASRGSISSMPWMK